MGTAGNGSQVFHVPWVEAAVGDGSGEGTMSLTCHLLCVLSLQLEAPEEQKELTPEEQLADKLRLKKLQEESDLELAKETFGELKQQEINKPLGPCKA